MLYRERSGSLEFGVFFRFECNHEEISVMRLIKLTKQNILIRDLDRCRKICIGRGYVYLLLSIILSTVLGCIILMMGPIVGGIVAFGIIVGCIFRGLYLLSDIHKRISNLSPEEDKVQKAYKEYLQEKSK